MFIPFLISFLLLASCENKVPAPQYSPVDVKPVNEKPSFNASALELPSFAASETIISHLGYVLSYNHQTLTPKWVAYELTVPTPPSAS